MSTDSDTSPASTITTPPANPALLGLPCFVVGGIGLGLFLIGYLPAAGLGALVPITLFVPGLGLLLAAVWATRAGQSAVGSIFGVFGTFWVSYGFLVLGLVTGWLNVGADAANAAQATFLIAWLVVFVALTAATLRLPMAFTVLFVLVSIAVALVLLSILTASAGLLTIAGVCALLFSAVGLYIYVGSMSAELGGKGLGLGNAVIG